MTTFPCFKVTQGEKIFYSFILPAKVVSKIGYVSVRGIDDEEGAVQRVLNKSRIDGIKDFALNVGVFPGSIIMNWTDSTTLTIGENTLTFDVNRERSAQIVDGQHRVKGIDAAIKESAEMGELDLPIVMYVGLNTSECADIFVSINTEQRTVPKSLVYDLYGVVGESVVDKAISRARDVAIYLNEFIDSPYRGLIKFPSDRNKKGGIALSTVVASIKPLIEDTGDLARIGVTSLESQQKVILNYFMAIKSKYDDEKWTATKNPFMFASGFVGATEFFRNTILTHCSQQRSFKVETIGAVLNFEADGLIDKDELKGLGGKDASRLIVTKLNNSFAPPMTTTDLEY